MADYLIVELNGSTSVLPLDLFTIEELNDLAGFSNKQAITNENNFVINGNPLIIQKQALFNSYHFNNHRSINTTHSNIGSKKSINFNGNKYTPGNHYI